MLGLQNQIRKYKKVSKINGYEVICVMSEVIYTKLELNPAKTFITGVWCDGVYFSAEPPLKATPKNEQWVRTETAKIAETHEDCILWRLERQIELKREAMAAARYEKYRKDRQSDQWKSSAYFHLRGAPRDEIKEETARLNAAWIKAIQYKAAPSVRDTDRDRKMLYEVSVKGRTLKDVAVEFGISSSRVSQIVARQQRRDHRFWVSRYQDHEVEGQVQDPEPEAADQGIGTEWTPETQYREFELLRETA